LLVLLGSIGLTAIAAIEAQRALRSQRLLAQRALRDYAGFAAWSYAQHLLVTFNAMEREVVGAVNHGDNLHTNPRVPEARDLAHYMPWDERCLCHRPRVGPSPDGFFAIKIGSPQLDIGVNTHPNPEQGWEVDRPLGVGIGASTNPTIPASYSAQEREWLVDSLTQQIRGLGEINRGFTLVVAELDSAPRIFAYTLMPTSWGDTMVYVARY